MVKLQGPLLSCDASGTIGNAITIQHTTSGTIATRYKRPRDPRTQPQLSRRDQLCVCHTAWCTLHPDEQHTFNAYADAHRITPYNAWIRQCMRLDLNYWTVAISDVGGTATIKGT